MRETYHPGYSGRKAKKKNNRFLWFFILLLVIAGGGFYVYLLLFAPNVYTPKNQPANLYIKTGSTFEDVKKSLYSQGLIVHRKNFELVADLKKYNNVVKPGHYLLKPDMSNIELVNKLRAGIQDPVEVTFNNVRFTDQLAGNISKQIEADSLSLIKLMTDTAFLDTLGVTPLSIFTVVIPNTYEFYWNTTARNFLNRMKKESDKFWGGKREQEMKKLNFTRLQVITLASIVDKETNKDDEKARVAGVYINRLNKGWLLEADPTLVFAHGNFEIKRVLNIYKQIDSPYNTYKYQGLPPGPICLPSVSSIDAVLNPEIHNYMFFCAREDFSGYHSFATTIEEHNVNAWKYQQALNQRNILN
ncbi:MAG TPA: endolytic transglycosylase MltG [Lentimicrobium sp.]|nr:endolytic transglycosylase MltG [Lentimicrobium sp.]